MKLRDDMLTIIHVPKKERYAKTFAEMEGDHVPTVADHDRWHFTLSKLRSMSKWELNDFLLDVCRDEKIISAMGWQRCWGRYYCEECGEEHECCKGWRSNFWTPEKPIWDEQAFLAQLVWRVLKFLHVE